MRGTIMTREEFCTISAQQSATNKRHTTHGVTRINSIIALRSYNSLCVVVDSKDYTITLYPHYDYSTTTSKHVTQFMHAYGFTDWNSYSRKSIVKSGAIAHCNGLFYRILLDMNRYYL